MVYAYLPIWLNHHFTIIRCGNLCEDLLILILLEISAQRMYPRVRDSI
jgi:hypothetical protein